MSMLLFAERDSAIFGLPDAKVNPSSPAAAGYSDSWITNGILGYAWRSGTAAQVHTIILLPEVAYDAVSMAALFDLRVLDDAATVSTVEAIVNFGADVVGTANGPSAHGDYGFRWEALPITNYVLEMRITLSAAANISIGEIVFADPVAIDPPFREWTRDERFNTVRNGAFAAKAGPRRMHIDANFAALKDAGHGLLMDAVGASEGALQPMIWMPDDSNPMEVYHGFLTDEHPHTQNPDGYHTGHGLTFVESRRAHGG